MIWPMHAHWYVCCSCVSHCALRLLQAGLVNQTGNTSSVIGNGSITNNNWAINIMQGAKKQVRSCVHVC